MLFADINIGEERTLVYPIAVPSIHSHCFFSSSFVTRRIVPLHPLIEVVNIDTHFDTRGRRGPCVICRVLRKLRSEHIGPPGSDQDKHGRLDLEI